MCNGTNRAKRCSTIRHWIKPSRHLLAFKLHIWSRISWALPEYALAKFSAAEMYDKHPAIEQHRQEIAAFYAQVPTRDDDLDGLEGAMYIVAITRPLH